MPIPQTYNHKQKTRNASFNVSGLKLQVKSGFTLIELLIACNPKSWRRKAIQGFTLIELLIVITILGILAALTLASYGNTQSKARDGVRKSDLAQIKRALELAKSDCQGNAYYPVMAGASETARFDALQLHLSDPDLNYMSVVPDDPSNSTTYMYAYNTDTAVVNVCPSTGTPPTITQSGAANFMMRTMLERGAADSESQNSFTKCTGKPGLPATAGGYYYVCNN